MPVQNILEGTIGIKKHEIRAACQLHFTLNEPQDPDAPAICVKWPVKGEVRGGVGTV